eukprot:scaffold30969_cov15-Tisochrysis_lutea.AAC.1
MPSSSFVLRLRFRHMPVKGQLPSLRSGKGHASLSPILLVIFQFLAEGIFGTLALYGRLKAIKILTANTPEYCFAADKQNGQKVKVAYVF